MRKINIASQSKFGKLTVIKEVAPLTTQIRSYRKFLCKCECGNEVEVLLDSLRSGKTTSCGCYRARKAMEINKRVNLFIVQGSDVIGFTTKSEPFKLDFEDLSKIKDYCWCKDGKYFKTNVKNTTIYLHKFILNLSKGEKVTFINKDTSDFRKFNLKIIKNKC